MKKYLIPLLLAGWTAGSVAAQNAGYVDDLYRGSTRASRAEQQQLRENRRAARIAESERRQAQQMPAQWTPNRPSQPAAPTTAAAQGTQRDELVTSFDDALQRRISAYRNYREMDDDYWKLMEGFHRTLSGRYDPDLYNVITFSNDMWVEPTYITALFDGSDPVGKTIRIGDIKLHVIGLLAKAGNSVAFNSLDQSILTPLSLAGNFINLRWAPTDMIITGPDGTDMEDLKAEVGSIMRRLRRLSPQTEDNFALNEVSIMNNMFDEMYRKINLAGGIIGLFSILVGGFGVANIMFVTVRERIVQIGIQKALGARPYFILCQFLFEAMILSVIGGAIGLAMVYIGTLLVNHFSNFTLVLTFSNILLGLTIASIVGAVAGLFP